MPEGQLSELPDQSTLFAAAMRQGLPLAHACPGEGLCGRCGLRILEGHAALSPETPQEQKIKADNRVDPALRIACLTRVVGSVTVTADYW